VIILLDDDDNDPSILDGFRVSPRTLAIPVQVPVASSNTSSLSQTLNRLTHTHNSFNTNVNSHTRHRKLGSGDSDVLTGFARDQYCTVAEFDRTLPNLADGDFIARTESSPLGSEMLLMAGFLHDRNSILVAYIREYRTACLLSYKE